MRLRLLIVTAILLSTGCADKGDSANSKFASHHVKSDNDGGNIESNDLYYCFFRIENKNDWTDVTVSDQDTKNIIRFAALYENNEVFLPPISADGKIWLAAGCAESIVEDIFKTAQYNITQTSYYEYRDQLNKASKDYTVIEGD